MLSLFLYKNKNLLVLLLLVLLSLFSISTYSVPFENLLNQVVYSALYPVTWLGGKFGVFVDSTLKGIKQLSAPVGEANRIITLEKEIAKLSVENNKLKNIVNEFAEEKVESQYLHSIFGKEVLLSQVVMRDLSYDKLVLVINKGTRHSLVENMPVVAFQPIYNHGKMQMKLAVVGKLTHLTYLHSKIIPILDPECNIHAQVNVEDPSGNVLLEWLGKSRGFLQGRFENDFTVLLTQLPKSLPIYIGNEVVTSGGQSIFPRGIKIGRIVKDISDSLGFMKEVVVLPYIDYVNVQRVWVVKRAVHPDIRYLMDIVK